MLNASQKNLLSSISSEKDLKERGLCLVEGDKNIEAAGKAINFTFTAKDTNKFGKLITTRTPQKRAGIATIPNYTKKELEKYPLIIILDGVQDPGNVGSIFRLCLGFNASLVLVDTADPFSAKVIRSSAGSIFTVPWNKIDRKKAVEMIESFDRPIYRLEASKKSVKKLPQKKSILIAGSEGSGITLPIHGTSLTITHNKKLESLNVGHALAIALSNFYKASFGL